MPHKITILATLLLSAVAAQAAPVEFETPSARVIVIRPMDSWSANPDRFEMMIKAKQAKSMSYYVYSSNGDILRGGTTVFQGPTNHPITLGVETAIKTFDGKLVNGAANIFRTLKPVTITAEDAANLSKTQDDIYQQMVIKQGNPATLQSRLASKKTSDGIVSLLGVIVGVKLLGVSSGIQMGADSKIVQTINLANSPLRFAVAPVKAPSLDFSTYKQIDLRRVESGGQVADHFGQIIIAYKGEKTEAAENEAMIRAIIEVSSITEPLEEIEKSRAEDYAARVAIWNACVAESKCSNETK